jgi:hypothetical protein
LMQLILHSMNLYKLTLITNVGENHEN